MPLSDRSMTARANDRTHVLVVDDDKLMRMLVRAVLEKAGFQVSEAVDGATALEYLEAGHSCDLLVLDLYMPELDGHEVLRRVRANADTARLPIVILTGSDGGEIQAKLMAEGADDYVKKPINALEFADHIKEVLQRAEG